MPQKLLLHILKTLFASSFALLLALHPASALASEHQQASEEHSSDEKTKEVEDFVPINPATNATAAPPINGVTFAEADTNAMSSQLFKGRLTKGQAELVAEARGRAFFLKYTKGELEKSADFVQFIENSHKEDFLAYVEALFFIRAINFDQDKAPGGGHVSKVTIGRSPRYSSLKEAAPKLASKDYIELLNMQLEREADTLEKIEKKIPSALLPAQSLKENFLPLEAEADILQSLSLCREALTSHKNDEGVDPPGNIEKNMREAIRLDPWNPLPQYILGESQLDLGNTSQALMAQSNALELKPDFPQALMSRGTAYLRLGLADLSIKDYSAAITLRPRNVSYYMARASALLVKENFSPMCDDFKKACELGNCDGYHWGVSRGHCKE